ncbi:uncharacterized protein F4812DRAFT_232197 [Daldinia caldariorum]|uniref:uncharacterized protein n=1 Tax=Daldinia caldariorum TaxID=326644 RepID=UPI0020088505|nr:uncharacterized protein F4812DRAFT_232197 [Daldinia caldariorum]KAI1463814.1 hypothetical protein F4812DRAFT_232197 [Daldinia caldariorum]
MAWARTLLCHFFSLGYRPVHPRGRFSRKQRCLNTSKTLILLDKSLLNSQDVFTLNRILISSPRRRGPHRGLVFGGGTSWRKDGGMVPLLRSLLLRNFTNGIIARTDNRKSSSRTNLDRAYGFSKRLLTLLWSPLKIVRYQKAEGLAFEFDESLPHDCRLLKKKKKKKKGETGRER